MWKRSNVQQYIPQIDACDSIVVETAGCLTLWLWDHKWLGMLPLRVFCLDKTKANLMEYLHPCEVYNNVKYSSTLTM